jgi:hypothetical protein
MQLARENNMDDNEKINTDRIAKALGSSEVFHIGKDTSLSKAKRLEFYKDRMKEINKSMKWTWPIANRKPLMPDYPGTFGAVRKFDIHSGVDLYCEIGDKIVAVEDGIVGEVAPFTGKQTGTPWWNDTEAVLVHGKSGVVVYGEVKSLVKPDEEVKAGQVIAEIEIPVLTEFRGRPTCMLHLELLDYEKIGNKDWLDHDWKLDHEKPEELLDPTDKLIESAVEEIECFDLKKYDGQSYTLHAPTTDMFFSAKIRAEDKVGYSYDQLGWQDEIKKEWFISDRDYGDFEFSSYSKNFSQLKESMISTIDALKKHGYKIRFYEINNIIISSGHSDILGSIND